MPRNNLGIYTAPSSSWNPATDDTTIASSDWNPLLSDLSQALTQSIATDGTSVVTTPIPFAGGIIGNASTATSVAHLTTGRTIGITGDLVYTSPTFDGSANITGASTLATVNSQPGTYGDSSHIPVFTVNGKGLITAASMISIGSAALQNIGTAGANVPLLSAANTWGGIQAFPTGTTVNAQRVAHVITGTAANSGQISWGTGAAPTLAEGEIYLMY